MPPERVAPWVENKVSQPYILSLIPQRRFTVILLSGLSLSEEVK